MGYGRRIGVEVRCDVVEDEFGGGAENVFDGAKGVPMEVGGVEEVGIGYDVNMFAEVGVGANPRRNSFGETNGGWGRGAEVRGDGDVVGWILWVKEDTVGVCIDVM